MYQLAAETFPGYERGGALRTKKIRDPVTGYYSRRIQDSKAVATQ